MSPTWVLFIPFAFMIPIGILWYVVTLSRRIAKRQKMLTPLMVIPGILFLIFTGFLLIAFASSTIRSYNYAKYFDDSDKDGAVNGWEKDNGYDPRVYNNTFTVTKSVASKNDLCSGIEAVLKGKQVFSLNIEETYNELLTNTDEIPGYIGVPAYDVFILGSTDRAVYSCEFDSVLLKESDFIPVIYSFDDGNQLFIELDTSVSGNIAYAPVTKSGTFILLNKMKVYNVELNAPFYGKDR